METKQLFILLLGFIFIILSVYQYPLNQAAVDFNNDLQSKSNIEIPSNIQRYYDQTPTFTLITSLVIGIAIVFIGLSIKK